MPAGIAACLEAIRQSANEAAWHYEVAMMLLSQRRVAEAIVHLQHLRLDGSHGKRWPRSRIEFVSDRSSA